MKTFSVYPEGQTPLQSSPQARQLGPGSPEAPPTLTCAEGPPARRASSLPDIPPGENLSFAACFATVAHPGVLGPASSMVRSSDQRPLCSGPPRKLRATSVPAGVVSLPGSPSNPGGYCCPGTSLCLGAESILLPVLQGHFRNLIIHLTSKEER